MNLFAHLTTTETPLVPLAALAGFAIGVALMAWRRSRGGE